MSLTCRPPLCSGETNQRVEPCPTRLIAAPRAVDADSFSTVELQVYTDGDYWLTEALETDPVVMRELGGPIERDKLPRSIAGGSPTVVVEDRRGAVRAGGRNHRRVGTRHGDEDLHETGWMVLPALQGRGIASAALTLLIDRVKVEPRFRASTRSHPSPTRRRTRCVASSDSSSLSRPISSTPGGRCAATTGRSKHLRLEIRSVLLSLVREGK